MLNKQPLRWSNCTSFASSLIATAFLPVKLSELLEVIWQFPPPLCPPSLYIPTLLDQDTEDYGLFKYIWFFYIIFQHYTTAYT